MPFIDADSVFPITHPDGTVSRTTIFLKNVVNHPRMEIGDYTYFTHYGKLSETEEILAPYLFRGSREKTSPPP